MITNCGVNFFLKYSNKHKFHGFITEKLCTKTWILGGYYEFRADITDVVPQPAMVVLVPSSGR